MTILDELAEYARKRVEHDKKKISPTEIKRLALSMPKGNFSFEKALRKYDIAFICECKKASPSKGIIAENFPYLDIAQEYEQAGADCISVLTEPSRFLGRGADCISVLTEPSRFLGRDSYLKEITEKVSIPCLRKDFTVDEYMIYQAKLLGASAVLLICSILDKSQIKEYINICDTLGLSALVEVHDENEIKTALQSGARIIGVNNRNLKDFSVDTENSRKLRELVPNDVIFVSESGVKTPEDVQKLRDIGANAVLIGETLMRAENKKDMLLKLKGKI